MPVIINNEIQRHRITDRWEIRFEGKLYCVERAHWPANTEELWKVTAIRYYPSGGQHHQELVNTSKLRQRVIEWIKQEIEK